MAKRKGCRATKAEKKCEHYCYSRGRCILGRVKYTCSRIEQPKKGTKAYRDAVAVRSFYGVNP